MLFNKEPNKRWMSEHELNKYSSAVDEYLKRSYSTNVDDDNTCLVNKELYCLNKKKTGGILLFSNSCGHIVNLYEMIRHEGLKIINKRLQEINSINRINYCVYDNACNLHQNVINNKIQDLEHIEFYIDRFHINNHIKQKCKKYNMALSPELEHINSQICEQTFNYFNRAKYMTKHMSKNHFNFFILMMVDNFNYKNLYKIKKK